MDSWYQPSRARYSQAVGGIPVHQTCHPKPKIKSIPVNFVGSETARPESAALRIQKVFRGFIVRKSIKRIMAIKKQVEEIERNALEKENMELIRKDAKERLRVNETLMALIFKLDSIRGVSPGIRDCRKAVIKKAVSLQEKVDFIAASPHDETALVSSDDSDEEAVDVENSNSPAAESLNQAQEPDHWDDEVVDAKNSNSAAAESVNQAREPDHRDEEVVDAENSNSPVAEPLDQAQEPDHRAEEVVDAENFNSVKETADDLIESGNLVDGREGCQGNEPVNEESELNLAENYDEMMDIHDYESEVNADEEESYVIKEVTESECVEEEKDVGAGTTKKLGLIEERSKEGNKQVLEKMVSDNEKMMKMMSELCERNELQTKMLSSLTKRVERLEKAFICCEKLRKKKSKTKHTPIA
ncbi:hypothetical protein LguiA_022126 [Lonicera macranthoides]